jgi:hypothetical protein
MRTPKTPKVESIGSSIVFALMVWASLAQIAPRYFQIDNIPTISIWLLLPIAGGWVLWLLFALNQRVRESSQVAVLPNSPVVLSGFEFYPSRNQLAVHRHLVKNIEAANEVWLLWNVGTEGGAKNITRTGKITRVLLADPRSEAVGMLAGAINRDRRDLVSDILVLTKQSLDNRVPVKWFCTMISDTVTIGNPRDPSRAWLQLETVLPAVESGDRPALRIERSKFDALFDAVKASYEERWKDSTNVEPTKELIATLERP